MATIFHPFSPFSIYIDCFTEYILDILLYSQITFILRHADPTVYIVQNYIVSKTTNFVGNVTEEVSLSKPLQNGPSMIEMYSRIASYCLIVSHCVIPLINLFVLCTVCVQKVCLFLLGIAYYLLFAYQKKKKKEGKVGFPISIQKYMYISDQESKIGGSVHAL